METNIDDCSGEMLGFVMEQLLDQGALDVFFTSIFMKKNRPAYKISILTKKKDLNKFIKLLLTETSTFGVRYKEYNRAKLDRKFIEADSTLDIRYRKEHRTVLKRQIKEIETPLGKLQVKEVEIDGEKRCYPEYESAKKLALKHQCSLQEIYHLVK